MTTALVTRTGTIYRLVSPSGKSYIGQTRRTVSVRVSAHLGQRKRGCLAIHSALKKYGADAFRIESVMVGVPAAALNFWEGFCVALFGTLAPAGYNLVTGGGASTRMSEETKERMRAIAGDPARRQETSERVKLAWATPEFRKAQEEGRKRAWGREGVREHHVAGARKAFSTPEMRKKLSDCHKAGAEAAANRTRERWTDANYRKNAQSAMRIYWDSDAARNRARAAAVRRWEAPGYRERVAAKTAWDLDSVEARSQKARERAARPEVLAKMTAHANLPESKARAGRDSRERWSDPAFRLRVSAAIKASRADPEQRERCVAAAKAAWADPVKKAARCAAISAAWARRKQEASWNH